MYINKTIVYGNITRDIELKALPSGQSVASFGVATNRTYKDKDGNKKEEVEYHNIVAFGKTAELINQYCKKGDGIYIEGRLQTRSWEKDGVKMYRTEIVTENMQFGNKKNTAPAEKPVDTSVDSKDEFGDDIDPNNIPF